MNVLYINKSTWRFYTVKRFILYITWKALILESPKQRREMFQLPVHGSSVLTVNTFRLLKKKRAAYILLQRSVKAT